MGPQLLRALRVTLALALLASAGAAQEKQKSHSLKTVAAGANQLPTCNQDREGFIYAVEDATSAAVLGAGGGTRQAFAGCEENPSTVFTWVAVAGAGSGEVNTISSDGGALALTAATPKVGVDLRTISAATADFDLAADVLSIDDTTWLNEAELDTFAELDAQIADQALGDVVGPGSSVDNGIPRFDSTTGKLLQGGSGCTIDDAANLNCTHATGSIALESLTVTSIADNEVPVGTGAGTAAFTALQDCADGTESLDFNGTAFVCNTITGGSASNSFETWSVPSGTNPVADGSADTVTFTAGQDIAITGTAGTDTIDIALDGDLTGGTTLGGAAIQTGTEDDTPDDDSEVPDAITVAGGTINTSSITLDLEAADQTVDGDIDYDTVEEVIEVGDDGVGTHKFSPDSVNASTYQPLDTELTLISGLAETTGNVMIGVAGAWASVAAPIIDCTNCTNIPAGAETNDLEATATSAGSNEIFVGSGVDAGAYIGITACAADEKIEYTDGAPNTFTCEAIGSLVDADVSDTLTASLFVGSGSTTTAIDLATAEVAGTLAAASVGNGLTDAQVLDNITIDLAATATALAANGSNCAAGSYPLGVDTAGAIETCTDASTETDSIVATHAAIATAHHTATVEVNDLQTTPPAAIIDDEIMVGTGAGTATLTALSNCTDGTESLDWNGTAFVCNTITGASGEWTLAAGVVAPNATTTSVAIGGTTAANSDIYFDDQGAAVFNEQGFIADFRIESDTGANAFFLDGTGAGAIGSGTASPSEELHIVRDQYPRVRLESDGVSGANAPGLELYDNSALKGGFFYDETTDLTVLWDTSGPRLAWDPAGDEAEAGLVRLAQSETICWEASPAGADECLAMDTSEQFTLGGSPVAVTATAPITLSAAGDIGSTAASASVAGHVTIGAQGFAGAKDFASDVDIDGFFDMGDRSELTIATGAVTATTSYHLVDTQADAADDDLDTINGCTASDYGRILTIRSANNARDVTVKNATDNLRLNGDFTLSHLDDTLTLICAESKWLEVSRSDGDGSDSIDIGDDTNFAAGRSLTLSGDSVEADAELYTKTKCYGLETPVDEDNMLFWRTDTAITVTQVDCLVNAATSAVVTLQECDANGGTCTAIEAAMTCAATNTAHASTIDNAAIDAGDWIRVDVGTVTGTVGHVNVCMVYTEDD